MYASHISTRLEFVNINEKVTSFLASSKFRVNGISDTLVLTWRILEILRKRDFSFQCRV